MNTMRAVDVVHVVVGGEMIMKVEFKERTHDAEGRVLRDNGQIRFLLVDRRSAREKRLQLVESVFAEQAPRCREIVAGYLQKALRFAKPDQLTH